MPKDLPTIIFDLGGVYFTDGTDSAITTISERYSVDRQVVTEVFFGEIGTKYRENKISIQEFWRIAKTIWKLENEPTDTLINIWHEGYIPIDGVCKIIKQLKSDGFELLFFSGSTKERVDYLENKYHFLQYFDSGIFSFMVGIRKSTLTVYHYLLEIASNNSENCIYIDNHEKYLVPARQLGMRTILFTTSENLCMTLKDWEIVSKSFF